MEKASYKVIWASDCVYTATSRIQAHDHDFYQILYVKEGSGQVKIGETLYEIGEGGVYVFRPFVMHEIRAGDGGLVSYEIKFELSDEKMSSALAQFPEALPFTNSAIEGVFEDILNEQRGLGPFKDEMLGIKFYEFLILLLRSTGDGAHTGRIHAESDRLHKVIDYINHHLAEDINLQTLAELAHLEKIYFLKQFKKKTKTTPMTYLRNARMREAKQLLVHSDMNITQISAAVGFPDVHHFSATFKRIVGLSPSEYKAQAH